MGAQLVAYVQAAHCKLTACIPRLDRVTGTVSDPVWDEPICKGVRVMGLRVWSWLVGIEKDANSLARLARKSSLIHHVTMPAETSPEVSSIATLGKNGAKARFGVAYLRAICSHAAVGFTETGTDEDVLAIDGKVEFAAGPARVQVKCTGQFRIDGGDTASWPAEDSWWDKWHRSKIPVYFIIVMVDPDDQLQWLEHRENGTFLRTAAFWVRVDRMTAAPSVTVPKSQRLTAGTLSEWAAEVDACFSPQEVGGAHAG
jgi:Domain of unknown function (DUF4365)